jgi:hypothetical protein
VKALLISSMLVAGAAHAAPGHGQLPVQQGARHVDVVIALDTSSSMDGLIDSARQKLWDVVNLLGQAKPQPVLRVGLIAYGNTGFNSQEGWVHKEADLTTDLDGIYSKLFALRTNGGTEYVARAVHDATKTMQWDQDQKTLKIIFVAGNEPANQDPMIPVESAVQDAREKGIFVNAIYCGSDSAGEAVGWRDVARVGGGKYAAIDQNHVVAINTPMDAELGRLSGELNKTYVTYGRTGKEKAANQMAQDANAGSLGGGAAASRAQAKSSGLYRNDEWDLLDARAHAGKDVKKMAADDLPAEMRNLKPEEREAYLDKKAKERAELQKRITDLSKQRDGYIAQERKKAAKPSSMAFDDAVTGAIRTEAQSVGFGF